MKVLECGLTDQIFSFFGEDGSEYHWNASKIIEAMNNDRLEPMLRVETDITDDIYEHVSKKNGIEEHHLVTIDEARLEVPVILVEFPGNPPTHVLIDGNHRLVARYRRGLRKISTAVFSKAQLVPFQIEDMNEVFR